MSLKARNQNTIKDEVIYRGKSLHRGREVMIKFKPAPENTGVVFVRTDLPSRPLIKACVENVTGVKRGTSIGRDGIEISTVEHVLAALAGLKIDNVFVELDSDEPPAVDGSAYPFVQLLEKAGKVAQSTKRKFLQIKEPIRVTDINQEENYERHIVVLPSQEFKVSFTIEYNHEAIKTQFAEFVINENNFKNEIASARTFGFQSEVDELHSQGLALGGSMENAIVIGEKEVLNDGLRFDNEFVRHKILDIIGDIFLIEADLFAHVIAIKSGHALNIELIKTLRKILKWPPAAGEEKKIYDIKEIMKVLPHRYPFLLVDRIIEMEIGKRAVGIKNVTMNEHFFNGHFPDKPIMPGVLIIEALAQVAGVFMLSCQDCRGKLPYFVGIDKFKFRRPVLPGDQVRLEVEVLRIRNQTGKVYGIAKVDGKVACEGQLMFTIVDG